MAEFELLGALAVLLGFGLVVLCFVPYLAWTYRRHGTVLPRHAVLVVGGAVYGVALWTYTILPLPQLTAEWCAQHATQAQLRPLQFVADVQQATGGPLGNAALRQVVLNVALFVPLGILARALGGWSLGRIAVVGFATSLLVELTQLTGNWGLYPCSYRVFDVDDLLVNTVGALLGGLLATATRRRTPFPTAPREPGIGTGRRLLGMLADVVAVQLTGVACLLVVSLAGDPAGHWRPPDPLTALLTDVLPAVALLLVVPVLAHGATVGQLATVVRPVGPDGEPPTRRQVSLRFLTGSGGYFLLTGLAAAGVGDALASLATAFAVVSLLAAWRTPAHRGLSGLAAGVIPVDARSTATEISRELHVDHGRQLRRMSTAVLSLATAGYLVLTAVAAIGQASSRAGLTAFAVLLVGLAVLTLVVIGYLLVNGAVMLRRERRSLGNLLSLLAGLGTTGLLAMCAVVIATGTGPAVALAVGALALCGYLAFLLLAFVGYGLVYGRAPAPAGVDAVVTLGSGLLGSRVPPLLAARLDRAVEIFRAEAANGNPPLMICSGGQGPGEAVSEAAAMADYLRARGIPSDLVVEEDRSRSTEQNLSLSWTLARDHDAHRPVAVTSDYHAFRAAQIATELGLPTDVVGARTARYYYPSAVLREFVGVLARRPLAYGLTGLLLAALPASVTLLVLT